MDERLIFPMNMARLCVDAWDGDLSGRVYCKQRPAPLRFAGFGEMLLRMDEMFDESGFPQAFQVKRSFRAQPGPGKRRRPVREEMDDLELRRQRGLLGTFDIVVQSRMRSGWQGFLTDTQQCRSMRFRSEMELLDRICDGLEDAG